MIACDSPYPPGVVGIISAELSRYPDFTKCLERLYVPHGTTWEWVEGVGFARNRNEIVKRMLARQEAQWLWFVDDDNTFAPDVLMRLLDRKVDIIQPLICNRKPPYNVHAYDIYISSADLRNDTEYQTARWSDIPKYGISEWGAVSTGGCLIRRQVFENLEYPWFEEGKTKADEPGEDLYFCKKAKEAGFKIWLDSDVEMGHMTKTTVFTRWHKGEWTIQFEMDKSRTIILPVNR